VQVELVESPTEWIIVVESDFILDLRAALAALPTEDRQLVAGDPVGYHSDLDESPDFRFTYGWAFPKKETA